MNKKDWSQVLSILGITFLLVIAASTVSDWLKKSPETPTIVYTRPTNVECAPDFLSYSKLSENPKRVVKLVPTRKSMFAENGRFINSEVVVTKNETVDSKVACGYLFIRAGTDSGALRSWEDVVMSPPGFGGHLIPASALSVNDGAPHSEYLYALNKLQYWPTRNRQEVFSADWAAVLNVSPVVPFLIALNTEDKSGFIDELSIAYKCWDPKSGEENDACSLTVTSRSDTETTALP